MEINNKIFQADNKKYRGILGRYRWSLCIGAGVSAQIAPTWFELAFKAFQHCVNIAIDESDFKNMVNDGGWGLDYWIQTAQNQWIIEGKSDEGFALLLRDILYKDILDNAEQSGLKELLILSFNDPFRLQYNDIEKLCSFISNCYPNNTTVQLVNFILDCFEAGKAPPL